MAKATQKPQNVVYQQFNMRHNLLYLMGYYFLDPKFKRKFTSQWYVYLNEQPLEMTQGLWTCGLCPVRGRKGYRVKNKAKRLSPHQLRLYWICSEKMWKFISSSKALQKLPKCCSKLCTKQKVAEVAVHNLYLILIPRARLEHEMIDSQQGAQRVFRIKLLKIN